MAKANSKLRDAIGHRLTHWRESEGGIQKKSFWSKYELDHVKMGRYENGREMPSPEKIVEICQKTGLSADYLLLGRKVGRF